MKKSGKVFPKIIKTMALALGILLGAALLTFTAARIVNGFSTRVGTQNGIQEKIYVEIGGQRQFLQIRGQDAANPVVFFLHGGPGSTMSYITYTYQPALEDDFTFVHWDQRGSGRTYYENKKDENQPLLTVDLLLQDVDAIVDYLCERFSQSQVIIMGHSWGTVLGTQYVLQHPEKVAAYVGLGQVVDAIQGDALAAETAAARAEEAGNTEDATALRAMAEEIAAQPGYTDKSMELMMDARKATAPYLGFEDETGTLEMIWLGLASPDMNLRDMRWFLHMNDADFLARQQGELMQAVYGFSVYRQSLAFEVPMLFITGREDWVTPCSMMQEYCEALTAPRKQMVVLEQAGHVLFLDQPDAFCSAVKEVLAA